MLDIFRQMIVMSHKHCFAYNLYALNYWIIQKCIATSPKKALKVLKLITSLGPVRLVWDLSRINWFTCNKGLLLNYDIQIWGLGGIQKDDIRWYRIGEGGSVKRWWMTLVADLEWGDTICIDKALIKKTLIYSEIHIIHLDKSHYIKK